MAPGQLQGALDAVSLQAARSLAPWLGLLFALFVASDLLLFDPPADRILATYDALLVALYFGAWLLLRRGAVPLRHAGTVAGGLLLLVLPYLLTVLWVTGQPLQSSGLALWQVGLGMFLLSWRWFAALLAVSNLAWLAVVSALPPSEEWSHFGVLLLSASVLAAVAHGVRLRTYRRLEALRLADEARRQELELALAEAQKMREVSRVSELKTRFMNVAAHELATPLTPIVIQMRLLRPMAAAMAPEARKSVEILGRSLDRLNLLVRDILDGSRLQADKLPLAADDIDLGALLAAGTESYLSAAGAAGVRLELHAPPGLQVRGDASRLHQVVANLLGNALKFTPAGGSVRVEARREGAEVRVEVTDTGAGFPPDQVELLFQPFSQLHESSPDRGRGTGLGLYIVRGIVERHGGHIGARSRGPGSGATFWFTLPLAGASS